MDVISGQDAFDDLNVQFRTGLANDLAQPLSHCALRLAERGGDILWPTPHGIDGKMWYDWLYNSS
jgi:hypothetical protein